MRIARFVRSGKSVYVACPGYNCIRGAFRKTPPDVLGSYGYNVKGANGDTDPTPGQGWVPLGLATRLDYGANFVVGGPRGGRRA